MNLTSGLIKIEFIQIPTFDEFHDDLWNFLSSGSNPNLTANNLKKLGNNSFHSFHGSEETQNKSPRRPLCASFGYPFKSASRLIMSRREIRCEHAQRVRYIKLSLIADNLLTCELASDDIDAIAVDMNL